MVTDAKQGKFQVLILSEQARVGRGNMIESTHILWQLSEYDVRIFEYMSGSEICVDDETGQIMTMMRSFASASERRQASRRVYDSARQRAHAGYVTGGRVFGYDNLAVTTPARRVIRTINPDQAAIVERIFTLYASGIGSVTITKMLNAEHLQAPRPQGWSNTGVRYVLANETYTGGVIWNQRQTVVKRGKKRHLPRPEREWIRTINEDLRIIADDLWQKVQAIRAGRKATLPRSPKTGKLLGRASWFDGYSDHSWTGFGTCAVCHGNIRIQTRRRGKVYECGTHRQRGHAMCPNDITVRQPLFDEALRLSLREVLNPDLVSLALTRAVNRLRTDQASSLDRKTMVENELASIQQRIDRLVDAVANGRLPGDEIQSCASKSRRSARML